MDTIMTVICGLSTVAIVVVISVYAVPPAVAAIKITVREVLGR